MTGKEPEAQNLTIIILRSKNYEENFIREVQIYLDKNEAAKEQLGHCAMMALETDREFKRYALLENCLRAILTRQGKGAEEDHFIYQVANAIGIENTNTISIMLQRMDEGKKKLTHEAINKACEPFMYASDRLFWKNMLLNCRVKTEAVADVADGPVLECLQAVWNCLDEEEKTRFREDAVYRYYGNWYTQMDAAEDTPVQHNRSLFDILESMHDWSEKDIQECMGICDKTWKQRKADWLAFENGGPFPSKPLKRNEVVRLCLAAKADLGTTLWLLGKAGYCLQDDERRLLGKYLSEAPSRQKLEELLYQFPDKKGNDSTWIVNKVFK